MTEPHLLVDRPDPRVATLTLNRPDRRNALSVDLLLALRSAIEELSSEPALRVIILRGAGPAFCAGLDFREALDAANSHRSAEALAGVYRALCASPLVTIAAAHGGAFGGGAGLIAACDLALAADDLQLGYPEVRRGLVAALVTCLLRRQVSGRRLREILLLGQTLSAREALDAGLVNRVVPAASLSAETLSLAAAVTEGAPGALARTKRLLDDLDGLQADLATALNVHVSARDDAEAHEGITAFFEKRPPRWALH
jgi:methylglutaconyl-CoA hydratase